MMEVETVNNGEEEYNSLMRPVMMTAKLISVWPLEKDSSTTAVILKGFHASSMFLLIGLTSIAISADIVHNLDDLDEATECALLSSAFYLSFIRLSVYTFHQKDILYVITIMRQDWAMAGRGDRAVLQEKCGLSFRLAKHFIIIVAVTVILFTFISFVDIYVMGTGERVLPFRGYFYANQTVSPIFECIYVTNVLAGFFCADMICAATTINLVITMHGAAKFAILRRHLEAVDKVDRDVKAVVGECVSLHQEAIA
ncbi:hypothetical protein KM043_001870 [Ampulex compressa]|nr:hypothetical protein KM043_001870 [Ampulex compressa]